MHDGTLSCAGTSCADSIPRLGSQTREEQLQREIWIVSNLPPPVHGVSMFNAALCDRLSRDQIPFRVFPIGARGQLTGVEAFGARKLVADTVQLADLLATSLRRRCSPVIYFTPSQRGLAVMRDAGVSRIARAAGIPLIGHIHGCAWLDEWQRGGWTSRVMLELLRPCEAVICLGETYARRMREATGLPCIGINNGVDAPRDRATKRLPPFGERIELLYLSNLIKSKGLWTAAVAALELHAAGHDVRLRCAGNWLRDTERADFEREFGRALAAGVVELVGFADEQRKHALLDSSHMFVFPTSYALEGQPLALIEAMAYGVVPITTRQGAIGDLLELPGSELLANDGHREAAAVASTIARLAAKPDEYASLSEACLKRYRNALTLDHCLKPLVSLLRGERVAP